MRGHLVGALGLVVGGQLLACGLSVVGHAEVDDTPVDDGGRVEAGPRTPPPDTDAAADAAVTSDADASETGTTIVSSVRSASSLTLDCVRATDGPIGLDGVNDGIFEVEITGAVSAIALLFTDNAGAPAGLQQWDTWVGQDVIPATAGVSFVYGASTYQLGVQESSGLVNDSNGRVSLPAGIHKLQLCATNLGTFVTNTHFRVIVQDAQGGIVFGPVIPY